MFRRCGGWPAVAGGWPAIGGGWPAVAGGWPAVAGGGLSGPPGSGGDVGVGDAPVAEPGGELALERQRLGVVPLEQGDEQGQQQEVVRAELEERDVVVRRQRLPLGVGELQPGAA